MKSVLALSRLPEYKGMIVKIIMFIFIEPGLWLPENKASFLLLAGPQVSSIFTYLHPSFYKQPFDFITPCNYMVELRLFVYELKHHPFPQFTIDVGHSYFFGRKKLEF